MGDVRDGSTVTHAENTAIASLELSKLAFFQACASCLLVNASSKSKHVHLISVGLKYADLHFHLKLVLSHPSIMLVQTATLH